MKIQRQFLTKISLGILLTIPFLLQLVGAVGLVAYLSNRSGERAVNDLANQLMNQVSVRIVERLELYLATPQQIVELNRVAIAKEKIDVADFAKLEQYFYQQIQIFPSLTTLSFGNVDGEVLGVGRDRHGVVTTPNTITLWDKRGAAPGVRRFYQIDEKRNRLKTIHVTPNFDSRRLLWYKTALKVGKPTWTPVFPALNLPITIISAVTPVYINGELQGVLNSDLLLEDISLFLDSLDFSPSGQTFIVEPTGELIASSTQERLFHRQGKELIRMQSTDSQNLLTRAVAQEAIAKWQDLNRIRASQSFSFLLDKQRQFVQITPYQNSYGLDWLIVTAIPETDFLADIQANNQRTLLLCGLTLLSATVTGIWTSRAIATPIHRLQQAATAITEGQLKRQIQVGGVGEVAQLGIAFERMAQQLDDTFGSLQASEKKFETFLQSIPLGITVFDRDSKAVLLNRAAKEILGRNEILNPLLSAKFSRDLPIYVAGTNRSYPVNKLPAIRALKGESTVLDDLEIEVEGKRIPLEVRTIPIFDEAGDVVYAINVFQDISERRHTEELRAGYEQELKCQVTRQTEAIRQGEALNRAIIEALPDSIIRMHRDGTYLNVKLSNAILKTILPATVGKNDRSILFPQLARKLLKATKEALQSSKAQIDEFPLLDDGRVIWQEARVVPLDKDDVLIVLRDLTERKTAELELLESEERFRSAFENTPIGTAIVSCSGKFLKVNSSLCNIVGYTKSELLTATLHDITALEDRQRVSEIRQQMLADNERVTQREICCVDKFGNTISCLLSLSLVKDSKVRPLYFIAQIQDLSDRDKIDRLKDEFISIVSHELRTPLTAINGSLGLLNTGFYNDKSDTAKELLQIAHNNSERMVCLVNDILDLERLESGKFKLVKEKCDLSTLLHQATESVKILADRDGIELIVNSCSYEILAAPNAIVQTLTNLLTNAIKFSPPGSTIWLTAELITNSFSSLFLKLESKDFEEESKAILFQVKDRGQGIPQNKLLSIFDRFQQVNISDSRDKKGTGLGLAICKSIVEQHGGRIWVESELGIGSTFFFTLPLSNYE
ncbi:PAS domain S-box protein [Myxosarcina sp. GI1]|uniref:PAS domain S-box protein n=1 Tax=Myxosarcina sp. GI1 TaxID=1541065 RepID=UPI0005624B25|nr:PAS domain S-box protein [Myxosarcina sp. GI1]